MKKLVLPLVLLTLFALAACADDDEVQFKKLNGVWVVDVEASLAMYESIGEMSPQEKEFAVGMANMMLSTMNMEFDVANKKIIAGIGSEQETTAFTVASSEGNNLVLQADDQTLDIEFKDDNTIIFGQADENRLVFVRKK